MPEPGYSGLGFAKVLFASGWGGRGGSAWRGRRSNRGYRDARLGIGFAAADQTSNKAQRQDTLGEAAEPSPHHAPPNRSSIPLRDRSDRGGQRTSRYLTTLIAPRGRAILASDLWITGRTLTPVPNQEKPPSTTGAVGVDPSRTTSMLHGEAPSAADVALRVRDRTPRLV